MWSADFIGSISTCFLFSGLFVLAAGVVKLVIDAMEKEANPKLTSAKISCVLNAAPAGLAPDRIRVGSET